MWYSFTQRENLKVHKGKKQFKCNICELSFLLWAYWINSWKKKPIRITFYIQTCKKLRERQKLYSWVLTQALTMEGWTKLAFVISDMYKCFSDDEEQQMIWLAAHISSNKKYSLVQNPKRQRWRYRDGDLLLIGYLGRQPDRDLLFFLLLPELLPPIYKYICLRGPERSTKQAYSHCFCTFWCDDLGFSIFHCPCLLSNQKN